MNSRDVALTGFRLLALWFSATAIQVLVELLLSWKSIHAQMSESMADISNPVTEGQLFLLMTSAMVARSVVGVGLWWLAPRLARLTFSDPETPGGSSASGWRSVVGMDSRRHAPTVGGILAQVEGRRFLDSSWILGAWSALQMARALWAEAGGPGSSQ